jgi:SHS2 domain-containing protein
VSFHLLEDAPPADVGFVAAGATLEECFRAAADATLEVMLGNPEALCLRERRVLHVESDSVELALLKLLEELIYYKDADGLFLRVTHVTAVRAGDRWVVDATAEGEAIDPTRHQLSGDVKAVTMHRLRVVHTEDGWQATVVLDI